MSVPKSVTELVKGSGNNFHSKVARWFQANDWHTVVSPYYMDQTQTKARELDLVVEKLWPIGIGGTFRGKVVVRLFVECKFVVGETVFWFAPKNTVAAKSIVCRLGPFRENDTYTLKHHYIAKSPNVAKLFASSKGNGQENEPFYKALSQALNATVAMRSQDPSHPTLAGPRNGKIKIVMLNYPVVVCSSFAQLYAVNFLAESEPIAIHENFQLEAQYAFHDKGGTSCNEYFLLDFVEFDQLASFEVDLAEGAKAAANLASAELLINER